VRKAIRVKKLKRWLVVEQIKKAVLCLAHVLIFASSSPEERFELLSFTKDFFPMRVRYGAKLSAKTPSLSTYCLMSLTRFPCSVVWLRP
jgi:hypothetical protein